MKKFDYTIIELIESSAKNFKAQPLNLGAFGGGGGGVGSPPGGYIGQLPQYRVAYDVTESATMSTLPSGLTGASGWSLIDNLNHIRARLNLLESGILVVDEYDGSPSVSEVTQITFSGATVSQLAAHHSLVTISIPTAITNTEDIFRCDNCGGSGWTGTINGAPAGAVVTYTHVSGNKNTLVPFATTQLGKQRLYNTTRGNYALISNSNGTSTITLTANAPGTWQSGDTITTLSQTVSGGGGLWVDIELTSGDFLNKASVVVSMIVYDSGAAGPLLTLHPFETYGGSKVVCEIPVYSTAALSVGQYLYKLNSNVITTKWTTSGAATGLVILREAGYLI